MSEAVEKTKAEITEDDEDLDDYIFDGKAFEEELRKIREEVQREYEEKHPDTETKEKNRKSGGFTLRDGGRLFPTDPPPKNNKRHK